ncbi:MAG: antibiotic biosynthesis monooxygenase [Actinomycetota bacterium]|nr:antibiotic biosynthesis monooxygenase [Actinomycetota bacterium]MDQ3432722.1 antibiotic biosynthesis monooxygenase [Actinomycetota bacterium]
MLVVTRHRVPPADTDAFVTGAQAAIAALAARPGWVEGTLGRNVDDPDLWVLSTRWADVGSYRRALSAYEVKVAAVPLLSTALDEPSAYEVVLGAGGDGTSSHAPDAGVAGPGADR